MVTYICKPLRLNEWLQDRIARCVPGYFPAFNWHHKFLSNEVNNCLLSRRIVNGILLYMKSKKILTNDEVLLHIQSSSVEKCFMKPMNAEVEIVVKNDMRSGKMEASD